ncbi:GH25 family lysozyme [Lactiplantibacillus herbarum]|uniref:GH25 family lysozyme n=1 Tax=Lactiplantibacillus herbarum TaxID=1670446 RepID=UPI001ED9AE1A|nr:GH25 family lysozyme [Lactiplantibacillus herbarum]
MKIKKRWGLILATVGVLFTFGVSMKASAAIPDISEWQGRLTSTQVSSLKSQVSFVINRVQYGSGYEDLYHTSNENLYVKYGVPFGSYDFATFTNVASAKAEAQKFYARANKNTRFYVLDFETTSMNSSTSNAAVKAWYSEMRSLTSKKLIFYSYQSFASTYANSSRQIFDAQWIANYSNRPTISYSLWQYTSSYYLKALGQNVDNSLSDSSSVTNYHPLSWWLSTSSASTTTTAKPVTKPVAKLVTYAYSSYKVGQYAYVLNSATGYYGSTKIPTSARQKMYKITAVKALTRFKSKQIVYVAGLNKWLYAQDINGYWANGAYGAFKVTANTAIYNNAALTSKTGKQVAKGASVKGTVVHQSGNTYQVKLDNGGYITGLVTASTYTAMAKPKPIVYAYSSYKVGQSAYVSSGAINYYGGAAIPKSVRQKMYRITAVKSVTKSRSKQIVYVSGLNKWLLAQDIGGYWPLGSSGKFTMKYGTANVYSDVKLSHRSGKTIKNGTKFSGKVVQSGRLYRIKLSSGGYITAAVQETNH